MEVQKTKWKERKLDESTENKKSTKYIAKENTIRKHKSNRNQRKQVKGT